MAIFRWPSAFDSLFPTLRRMQEDMGRLLGRGTTGEAEWFGGFGYPPVNVLNGPEDVLVEFEVAGVRREDIDITITGDTLQIKGSKRAPEDADKLRYLMRERGTGEFVRTIVLPEHVDADKVEARLDAGVLTIRLPKAQTAKPKQIPLK